LGKNKTLNGRPILGRHRLSNKIFKFADNIVNWDQRIALFKTHF